MAIFKFNADEKRTLGMEGLSMISTIHYNPEYLNIRPVFSKEQKKELNGIGSSMPLDLFLDGATNAESIIAISIYASSLIENCTYTLPEALRAIFTGRTASDKPYQEALALINMRKAFDFVLEARPTKISLQLILRLHDILMAGLLPEPRKGALRKESHRVLEGGYLPPNGINFLSKELIRIVVNSGGYADPYERAVYLHCNLAYIQCFSDGNKRTARFIQSASLMSDGLLPLFYHEEFTGRYRDAVTTYYSSGEYKPYTEMFLEEYRVSQELILPGLHR